MNTVNHMEKECISLGIESHMSSGKVQFEDCSHAVLMAATEGQFSLANSLDFCCGVYGEKCINRIMEIGVSAVNIMSEKNGCWKCQQILGIWELGKIEKLIINKEISCTFETIVMPSTKGTV